MRVTPSSPPNLSHPPHTHRSWRAALTPVALTLILHACAGNVSGSLGGNSGGVGGPSTGATGNPGGGPFLGETDVLEPTGLHRLNADEYDATVRDLLGTKSKFGSNFLQDEVADVFDNNASALSITDARLRDYRMAAESLADELVADTTGTLAALAPCNGGMAQSSCLTKFASSLATRAWRRPVTQVEVDKLVASASSSDGTYAGQIKLITTAVLISPYFLYRIEIGEGRKDGLLNPYELATRLSYFLWSSMPDAELTAAAANGSLLRDEVLDAQVTRMLGDPKAKTFAERFAGMWLGLRQARTYVPDPTTFPNFDVDLQSSAVAQTELTFNDLLAGKIAFHELFDGNQIYLNDRLAKHYNLPAPNSTKLVLAPAANRRGVLTQAAFLMGQSKVDRTSLVHRGAFLLHNLNCANPPGAPPNVPSLPDANPEAKTQRQRLEAHATVPACAVCHNFIDPYGFVLESYDAIGAFRTTDNGGVIDTSTTLIDGTKVANVDELSSVFAKNSAVSSCFVQQLSTYAIGRTLTTSDATEINGLQARLLNDGQRVDRLVHKLVLSPMFRRRG